MRVAKLDPAESPLKSPGLVLLDNEESPVEAVSGFLGALIPRGCSPNTVTAYAHDLKRFYTFLHSEGLTLETFTTSWAIAFLTHLSNTRTKRAQSGGNRAEAPVLAVSTRNRILAAVSTFYEHLIVTEALGGVVSENPLDPGGDHRRPGIPRRPIRRAMRLRRVRRLPRALTDEQVTALLDATRSLRDKAVLLLMLQGGLRAGEVLNLHLEDVQYGRRRIAVRWREDHPKGVRTKCRVERLVDLLEPETLAAVSSYVAHERPREAAGTSHVFLVGGSGPHRGEPLSYAALAKSFKRRCQRIGLMQAWITPHALRHTHATRLWEGGMRELSLQKRLGHASFEATRSYTEVSDAALVADYKQALDRRQAPAEHAQKARETKG